jgi:hypothetical protein
MNTMSKTTSNVTAEQKQSAQAAIEAARQTSAPALAGAPVAEAKAPVTTTLQLGGTAPVGAGTGRRFQKNWFLNRTDDLAVVTDESSNEAFGILNIQIQAPTAKQLESGIICKVAMETTTGWDYGITIWESKEHAGDIMLMVGGAREGGIVEKTGKKQYFRDRRLTDATTAQILSYVYKHLQPRQ